MCFYLFRADWDPPLYLSNLHNLPGTQWATVETFLVLGKKVAGTFVPGPFGGKAPTNSIPQDEDFRPHLHQIQCKIAAFLRWSPYLYVVVLFATVENKNRLHWLKTLGPAQAFGHYVCVNLWQPERSSIPQKHSNLKPWPHLMDSCYVN